MRSGHPGRSRRAAWVLIACGVAAAAGCARPAPSAGGPGLAIAAPPPPDEARPSVHPTRAVLPAAAGAYGPSQARLAEPDGFDARVHADTTSCGDCHADEADEWAGSAHAYSSFNNPFYRLSIASFRAARGDEASRFCGGCHDQALTFTGGLDQAVRPDDDRAHVGITCAVCHGIVAVRPDGDASYTLSTAPVPTPRPGDPASLEAHRRRVRPEPLGTVAMCTSCHRGTLGPPMGHAFRLPGLGEPSAWSHGAWSGASLSHVDERLPTRTCVDCHMPLVRGDDGEERRSHRFLGGHTALAATREDPRVLEQVVAQLRGAVTLDVAAIRWADGRLALPAEVARVVAGDAIEVDVVVRNVGAGHRFPGGALDMHDTWVELEVFDAWGRRLAEAGTEHADSGADPTAHVLKSWVVDDRGGVVEEHAVERLRTVVANHTVGPRDAAVVRYAVAVPPELGAGGLPLTITARLRHRRYDARHAAATCRLEREDGFAAQAKRRDEHPLDGCAALPVTELAAATVTLGQAAAAGVTAPWRRLADHGLALSHQIQERVDEARPPLELALTLLGPSAAPRDLAIVESLLARVAVRQSRVEEALSRLARVEALAPGEPATAYQRGLLFAQVWRWPQAAAAFAEAAKRAPNAPQLWARLAMARASAGDDRGALQAAQRGLALRPRGPDLLRAQALALEALGAPPAEAAAARAAWLTNRRDDHANHHRAKCVDRDPRCRLERQPVHVHATRPAR